MPAYVKLLRDTEAEVRVAAAGKVSAICKMLSADRVISAVVPCVKDLAADSSQHVRSALASVVMEVAPVLGKSATIEHLLPVFLSLLKDDFPEVRLNIISKLDQVNQVLHVQPYTSTLVSDHQSPAGIGCQALCACWNFVSPA